MATRNLPAKVKLPKWNEKWSWKEKYFDVGDEIEYLATGVGGDWKVHKEIVTKVSANQFGRISYQTKEERLILMEDVRKVVDAKAFKK